MAIEEKTPKGYVLKINPQKQSFIAFDRLGGTVYYGPHQESTIHSIPNLCFLGKQFILKQRMLDSYYLVKISRQKLLIPYYVAGHKDRHYHLLPTEETMDMLPVRLVSADSILNFIQLVEDGYKPDVIFIQSDMSENDIVIFRNRYPKGELVIVDLESHALVTREDEDDEKEHDYFVNLNTMSTNPFFLSCIHLRDFKLSSVKQILFDFDLSPQDCTDIESYLGIIKQDEKYPDPERNRGKLEELITDFRFYHALISKNAEEVNEIVGRADTQSRISSYMTILAKARSVITESSSDLDFVDYENSLYDKKEELEKAVSPSSDEG